MAIDIRTLMICNLCISLFFCLAFLVYLAGQKTQPGFRRWTLGIFLHAFGFIFLVLRGAIPMDVSILAANGLIVLAMVVRLDALNRFIQAKALARWVYALPIAAALGCYYFYRVQDHIGMRGLIVSSILFFLAMAVFRLFVRFAPGANRVIYDLAALLVLVRGLTLMARSLSWLSHPTDTLFQAGAAHSLHFLIGMVAETGINILFLMMNTQQAETRLKSANNALTDSENRYRGLSDAAFEGIAITENGRIIEANENACRMFGYTTKDFVGRIATDLIVEADRDRVRSRIMSGDEQTYEVRGLRQDGSELLVEIQAKMFEYQGVMTRVAALRDITERRKIDEERAINQKRLEAFLRLSVTEFPSKDSLVEFALEEGIKLTRSQVGYLHFLNEDQATLYLYRWSQSVAGQCTAEKTPHYPLEKAGIWADCIRKREPVIHNDYPGLADKKGVPDGHFPIARHMSVPIYDGRRIIGVAGVGNKEAAYDESDAKQLSIYMNNMWHLFKQKRGEEELQKANESLKAAHAQMAEKNRELNRLSMTDTLTGLLNRRAMMPIIEKEMNRRKRFSHPVSFLILDLDYFKRVNDLFGHSAGDDVLAGVAAKMTAILRNTDSIGRWGGEEFAILAVDTNGDRAVALGEKIRAAVQAIKFPDIGRVTASIGVAEYLPDEDFRHWYERADQALYQAKSSGRNCVRKSPEPTGKAGQPAA